MVSLGVGLVLVAGVTGCQARRGDAPSETSPEERSAVSSAVAPGGPSEVTPGAPSEGTSARAAEAVQAASIEAALRSADAVLASLDEALASDPEQ